MGLKEPNTTGKGADFKVEKNERAARQVTGQRANLDRLGSLGHCIESVIRAGAYISFGATSDGGAVLVRILDGSDKLSSYCHSDAEILEAMEALETRYKRKDAPGPLLALLDKPK